MLEICSSIISRNMQVYKDKIIILPLPEDYCPVSRKKDLEGRKLPCQAPFYLVIRQNQSLRRKKYNVDSFIYINAMQSFIYINAMELT
jgi:hypothetical protein